MLVVKDLFIGLGAFIVAHFITFYQLNGQFLKTDFFRKNEIWVAAFGVIIFFFTFGELNIRLVELEDYYGLLDL